MATHPALARAAAFAGRFGLDVPVLMAPMAGASPPDLSIAVARAGGMGACGALLMAPEAIGGWSAAMRAGSNGAFQLNTWIPGAAPVRDAAHEAKLRAFLAGWGPEVPADAPDAAAPDFMAQCEAMLAAGPAVMSSIMGLYPPSIAARMKAQGVAWFACVTTVAEARAAEAAGADVLVAQGAEAGGHRGAFQAAHAARDAVGLMALLPAVVDATHLPVVATGGIADGRTAAAALLLGASAVQIGTALLRAPEAGIAPAWAKALEEAAPEDTVTTRAFSGRLGRSLRTDFTDAASDGPAPAPYPVQRALTGPMRARAAQDDDLAAMQAWAGQSARLGPSAPAAEIVTGLWDDARTLLGGAA